MGNSLVLDFASLRMTDVETVGGKNASLGEMISQLAQSGVRVPGGFATTAEAYRYFMTENGLTDKINTTLDALDVDDVNALVKTGEMIRGWVNSASFPKPLEDAIRDAYSQMQASTVDLSVAVRSSATAEDLPDASFAGQQETFLNIVGIDNVLTAIKEVFASLYNDRAISYRVHKGFAHHDVALSAGIQQMVRSDTGASGVMFTIDTESGFSEAVFITSSYGLGEMVVQGAVNPDEFYVHKVGLAAGRPAVLRRNIGSKLEKMIFTNDASVGKSVEITSVAQEDQQRFSIDDTQVEQLARYAMIIESHYGRPMDIEWGLDGRDGELYILQARPETVKSQETAQTQQRFVLKGKGNVLAEGRAIGQRIGVGKVRLVQSADSMDIVEPGDVLVTDMTDPNWEPVMKRAAAIVTNRGGRTCHAAIIARELGIPAIVGCGDATEQLTDGAMVTAACSEGDTGLIFDGELEYVIESDEQKELPEIPLKIMMNVGNPDLAFKFAQQPHKGVGLARVEFIINNVIGIHPKAILDYPSVPSDIKAQIDRRAAGYESPVDFFKQKLIEGVSTIAAAFYPEKVIVRLSDFKSNEYRKLVAGDLYEPEEENPMLGFRGAARYLSSDYAQSFAMECEAMKTIRDDMGLTNVELMIPFVRTPAEGKAVIDLLESHGLKRGENGLRVVMMCELPTNALLADQYLDHFDGFSIGSNDLTQLTLGLDRDSGLVAEGFDERDDAVKALLSMAIKACRARDKYVGICGQGPSDHLDFAIWLQAQGIESISLNPDTVVNTWTALGGAL
ncbi:MAG: phosphoenolpyruvate synthase [Gammaproteobacteria bacterium]|nr:phosphoenolpyruvate synthase [Gammaproteobacteria bacterium]